MRNISQIGEHFLFMAVSDIDMHRYAIGTDSYGLLYRTDEGLGIWLGGERCARGKMDYQSHIRSALAMSAADNPFMYYNGVRSSFSNLGHGLLHVSDAHYGPHADSMVHRDNNGFIGDAINDSLQSHFFTNHFSSLPQ